ncbi:serine/threonine-protein kinase [Streptomyces melanogenes]|uniref:serine/threonine-protein kinase n=1 Tax=Streptomyces melanogenes TaxID=67326 RepID=UPI0037BA4431
MDDLLAEDPHRVGPFRLLGRLGAGGMGRVYLGESPNGRPAAVKLVREPYAADPAFRQRLRQDVEAARRVGGAWAAYVLDADTQAQIPWIATAYVAGPSLQDVVERGFGPLPEPTLLVLADRLALALDDIHDAGLRHRDLKPSHVLLAMDGPRVIDFGITRAMEASAGARVVVGTPGFMAPEQFRGEPVTAAADVFSLGTVLAYAATGRMAFGMPDGDIGALVRRVVHEEPDLVGVPASLLPVVRACLHKDPARRPTPGQLTGYLASGSPGQSWLPREVSAQLARYAVQSGESVVSPGYRRRYLPPVPEDSNRPDPPPPLPWSASEPAPSPPPHRASLPRGPAWGSRRRTRRRTALLVAFAVLAVAVAVAWFVVRTVT